MQGRIQKDGTEFSDDYVDLLGHLECNSEDYE